MHNKEIGTLTSASTRVDSGTGDVVLVEFADYQCPFCQKMRPVISEFEKQNPQVGIVFRFLPLKDIHPLAEPAAIAAICAEEQNRFQAIHSLLYGAVNSDEEPQWLQIAGAAGVRDLEEFEHCMHSDRAKARLDVDARLARELGITGTPTFVHRGGIKVGDQPSVEAFERMLAEAR